MQIQAAFQFCHLCQLRQPTFSPIPQKLIKFAWMKPQDKYGCYQATSIAFENVKASHRRGKANLRSIHRPNSNCNYDLEIPSLISDPCENLVAKAWLLAWESPEPAYQIFTTFSEPTPEHILVTSEHVRSASHDRHVLPQQISPRVIGSLVPLQFSLGYQPQVQRLILLGNIGGFWLYVANMSLDFSGDASLRVKPDQGSSCRIP